MTEEEDPKKIKEDLIDSINDFRRFLFVAEQFIVQKHQTESEGIILRRFIFTIKMVEGLNILFKALMHDMDEILQNKKGVN